MEIIEYFKLPEKAKASQRLYVNQIVEQANATGNDKKLLEKSIKNFYLVGVLSEDTCGLWSVKNDEYFYEMVLIFHVIVKDESKIKSLNELLQKTFPNPTIIVYQNGSEFMFSTAMKRLNKVEKDKTVIDSLQTTEWFTLDELHKELLNRINFNKRDLKDFYESVDYIISAEYLTKLNGKVPEIIDYSIKAKSGMVQRLLEEKSKYIEQEKEESSMQGKMQCHMKIKEINEKIERVK